MKRTIAIIAAIILLASLVFAGTAMADEKEDLVGVWNLQTIKEGSIEMGAAILSTLGFNMVMTLNEDGTATKEQGGKITEGVWSVEDGTVNFGTECTFTFEDGVLTVQDGTQLSIFSKEGSDEGNGLAPAVTDAEISDFEGTWNAVSYSAMGMSLNLADSGVEIILTIKDDKALVTENIKRKDDEGEKIETVELELDVEMKEDGTLYVDFGGQSILEEVGLSADGIVLTLHEDGKLSGTMPETEEPEEAQTIATEGTETEETNDDAGASAGGSSGGESLDMYLLLEKV